MEPEQAVQWAGSDDPHELAARLVHSAAGIVAELRLCERQRLSYDFVRGWPHEPRRRRVLDEISQHLQKVACPSDREPARRWAIKAAFAVMDHDGAREFMRTLARDFVDSGVVSRTRIGEIASACALTVPRAALAAQSSAFLRMCQQRGWAHRGRLITLLERFKGSGKPLSERELHYLGRGRKREIDALRTVAEIARTKLDA